MQPEPTPGYPSPPRQTTRIGLAVTSGLLYAGSFPPLDAGDLAFVCLVPLLVALAGAPPRAALLLGWIAGTVATGLLVAPSIFAAVRGAFDGSIAVALAASLVIPQLYGAIWFALFGVGASVLLARGSSGLAGVVATLLVPAAWAGLELVRSRIGSGCPWVLLAHAITHRPAWMQLAAWAGAPGVSFALACVNTAFAVLVVGVAGGRSGAPTHAPPHRTDATEGLRAATRPPGSARAASSSRVAWPAIAVTGLLGAAAWWLGSSELARPLPAGEPLRVALVQTAAPAEWRLSILHLRDVLARLAELTAQAGAGNPDLVVWPENALAVSPATNPAPVARTLREGAPRAFLLASGPRAAGTADGSAELRNSVVAFAPSGEVVASYDKVRLTPFGEESPFSAIPGLRSLVASPTPYSPGPRAAPVEVGGRRIATPICLELIYADLVRDMVRDGARLLVNLSNDDWFGETAAVEQHFRAGLLRAVETRRWLLRATTSGVTAVVDPRGRTVARLPRHQARTLAAEVQLLDGETPYVRFGDLFGLVALLLAGLGVAVRWRPGRGLSRGAG